MNQKLRLEKFMKTVCEHCGEDGLWIQKNKIVCVQEEDGNLEQAPLYCGPCLQLVRERADET